LRSDIGIKRTGEHKKSIALLFSGKTLKYFNVVNYRSGNSVYFLKIKQLNYVVYYLNINNGQDNFIRDFT